MRVSQGRIIILLVVSINKHTTKKLRIPNIQNSSLCRRTVVAEVLLKTKIN